MYEKVWTSPDVYRVVIPFDHAGPYEVNCYILHSKGDWLLVDTGGPGPEGRRILRAAFNDLQVDFSRCKLFLTHMHFDHSGQLNGMIPHGVPVYMSKVGYDYRLGDTQKRNTQLFVRRMMALGVPFDEACQYAACNTEIVPIYPDAFEYRFVKHGDTITVGDCTFTVLDTSGHTPDHMSLYERQKNLLFGGDQVIYHTNPSVDALPGIGDGIERFRRSLYYVQDLHVQTLFPGHEAVQRNGINDRIEQLIAAKQRDLTRVMRDIGRYPYSLGTDIAMRAFAHRTPKEWFELHPISRYYFLLKTFVCLQHLCLHNYIVRHIDDDMAYRYSLADD